MNLYVESVFDCPPEAAWSEVQKPRLLAEVMWPLLRFEPAPGESFPEQWTEGTVIRGRAYKMSVAPLGTHTIHFDRVDAKARQIATREHNYFVQRWDHVVSIRETSDGRTRYSDALEIDAGVLTPFVWLFAQVFYRHRQRRWRRIARRLA